MERCVIPYPCALCEVKLISPFLSQSDKPECYQRTGAPGNLFDVASVFDGRPSKTADAGNGGVGKTWQPQVTPNDLALPAAPCKNPGSHLRPESDKHL